MQHLSQMSSLSWLSELGLASLTATAISATTVIPTAVPVTATTAQPIADASIAENRPASIQERLVGQWHLKDVLPVPVNIVFTPDGKMYALLPSFWAGGPFDAIAYEFQYRLNARTSPMQLDLIVPSNNEQYRTIVELIDDNRLRVEYFGITSDKPRPKEFTTGNIVLEKISELTNLPKNTTISDIHTQVNQQSIRARESEARTYVGATGRAQQAYFLEKAKFATELDDLGVGIQPETENYRYQLVPQGNGTERAFATATAKRPELRSYASAVFVVEQNGEKITIMGICRTEQSSQKPPKMPKLKQVDSGSFEIECPIGSERYPK